MNNTVYIVIRSGVYRHEILGVYSKLEDADAAAKAALKDEPDEYHSMEVCEASLNERIEDATILYCLHKRNEVIVKTEL